MLDQIHQDALWVLEEAGVKCDSSKVHRIIEAIGHLYVQAPLVEQAFTTIPKRDHYWIPRNSFGVGGTALFVFDDLAEEWV